MGIRRIGGFYILWMRTENKKSFMEISRQLWYDVRSRKKDLGAFQ